MNNTYNDGGKWNKALNALPQNQRGAYKCANIAQVERQKIGTPSYRILNVYINTHSPVVGHPWQVSNSSYIFTDSSSGSIYTLTVSNGSFIITPVTIGSSGLLVFQDTVTKSLYSVSISGASIIINSYTGAVLPVSSLVLIDTITQTFYSMTVSNGTLTIMTV